MSKVIAAHELVERIAARSCMTAGSSAAEAQVVADNLVLANLSGHDSHGVGMVPRYVDAVLEGGLQAQCRRQGSCWTWAPAHARWPARLWTSRGRTGHAVGHGPCQKHGSCIMTLANAHHLGRIGHFAEMAVAQGLVAIHFVNVLSRPVVAPFGGATAALAPTRAASACRWPGRHRSCSTSPPAGWRKARCASPTTRGKSVEPGT
jgi:uncharacterized oxidoreductase